MDHQDDRAQAFASAGFTLEEFIGCWMKTEAGLEITISDGMSINDLMYEVQVRTSDGEDLDTSHGNETPEGAIAAAAAMVARYVAIFADRRYLCHWGAGYDAQDEVRPFASFSDDNGYPAENITAIARLEVGDTVDLSDLSGEHTVTRVADAKAAA